MQRRICSSFVGFVALIVGMSLFLSGCNAPGKTGGDEGLKFSSEYQAVFMDNGQVFFGKLENAGSSYPLLKNVFYIGRQQSPETKEFRNILIKRGSEWHEPEYMYINKQHIAVIEPVAPKSRVASLIAQAQAQKTAPAPETAPTQTPTLAPQP
jgi:hypothetical protein